MKRNFDQNKTLGDFCGQKLVVCPQCSQCADVIIIHLDQRHIVSKLTCVHCGFYAQTEKHANYNIIQRGKIDTFNQPLWLQAPCEGNILWAFNYEHLQYIRDYIEADLRESQGLGTGQYYSALKRLPRWAKLASNRETVLAIIDKMRMR